MTAVYIYEVWRLIGMGFAVALAGFTIGGLIGKSIGYRHAVQLLRPDLVKK